MFEIGLCKGKALTELIGRARQRAAHRLVSLAECFRADKAGTILVIAALAMPVAIGGMGLGAEVGLWYYLQRQLQHAADTASHGAGIRKRQGDSQIEIEEVALALAIEGGFKPYRGSIAVTNPPSSGPNAGNPRAVEVVLSETIPRMFTAFFAKEPVNLSARAVSMYTNPSFACVLALAPNKSSSLMAPGGSSVNLLDCDTASNSMANDAFDMQGSANYSTACVHTVGWAQPTGGLTLTNCPFVDELAPLTLDPYADVAMPAVVGPCYSKNVGNPINPVTVTPTYNHPSGLKSRRYCHGLHLTGQVHFEPGIYIIEHDDFIANAGAEITGDNVMFFFTDGAQSRLNGSADLVLTPPDSGDYSGILFFGDRTEPGITHRVNGGSGTSFGGAVYFAAQRVIYNGGAGAAGGCTQIIGDTIEFAGTSDVSLDCTGVGVKDIEVAGNVEIVE